MAEYIERDKVYQDVGMLVIDNDDLTRYEDGRNMGVFNAMSVIENAPAADVRPERHGHWERVPLDDQDEGRFICSKCKEEFFNPSDDEDMLPNFCPNCGAKMDGKDGNKND